MQRVRLTVIGVAVLLLAFLSVPASAQLQFSSTDGTMSFKIGTLAQLQGESLDTTSGTETSNNLFFRRLRLLGSFNMDKLTVYFDTDNPNLGKGNADGSKNNIDMYIQDFLVTYAFAKEFQLEGGEILTPLSYNHLQSAASLLAIDYGPYTFNNSTPLTERVGRDYGLQARGYLGDDHLEYRAGLFQGFRGINATNDLRFAGRLAYNVFSAQTGPFYRGTSLGTIQSLTFGASYDKQKSYKAWDGDVFYDQPLPGGDGITVQGDYQAFDGGTLVNLPKQRDILLEAGYYIKALTLQPWVEYAKETFSDHKAPNEKQTRVGLSYFIKGQTSNLKFGYGRIERDLAPKRNQFVLQYQFFLF